MEHWAGPLPTGGVVRGGISGAMLENWAGPLPTGGVVSGAGYMDNVGTLGGAFAYGGAWLEVVSWTLPA